MIAMEDSLSPEANRGFKDYKKVRDLEARFYQEDRQKYFRFENSHSFGVSI